MRSPSPAYAVTDAVWALLSGALGALASAGFFDVAASRPCFPGARGRPRGRGGARRHLLVVPLRKRAYTLALEVR